MGEEVLDLTADHLRFCRDLTPSDIQKLPFQKPVFDNVRNSVIARQAEFYSLAKSKFPVLWKMAVFAFPDRTALEQASSQSTAIWKRILRPESGDCMVDACAGLGIDAFYLGFGISEIHLFEADSLRATCLRSNFDRLQKSGYYVHSKPFNPEFLKELLVWHPRLFVYADPDRRAEGKRKSSWKEALPSPLEIWKCLNGSTARFLLKISPMDDPVELIEAMPGAQKVVVLSLANEVKEVLILWDFAVHIATEFWAVNIRKDGKWARVVIPELRQLGLEFAEPVAGGYLLDPWSCIRKGESALALASANKWGVLSPEARLFFVDGEPMDFPGRIFKIESVHSALPRFDRHEKEWNVVSRNFPQSAEELRNLHGLTEKGERFLFCYRNPSGQRIYIKAVRIANTWSPGFYKDLEFPGL